MRLELENHGRDISDLVEAAETLERQLDTEPGLILRHLTSLLKKQAEFRRLKARFGGVAERN